MTKKDVLARLEKLIKEIEDLKEKIYNEKDDFYYKDIEQLNEHIRILLYKNLYNYYS